MDLIPLCCWGEITIFQITHSLNCKAMKAQKKSGLLNSKQLCERTSDLSWYLSPRRQIIRLSLLILIVITAFIGNVSGQYQIETLDRGLIAVKTTDTSVFISWRLLATDPD